MNVEVKDSQVSIESIVIKDRDLANYLKEVDDPDEALIQLILVGNKVRSSFQTTLETQNIRTAADDLIKAMEEKYKKMVLDLNTSIDSMLDKDKGALALRIKELAINEIKPMLDPSQGDLDSQQKSPIHRLKVAVNTHVDNFERRVSETIKDIKDILEGETGQRGTSEGFDFEDRVSKLIAPLAQIHGDTFELTGKKPTKSGALVGDAVVEINPEYRLGKQMRVVWEMKSEKKFKFLRKVQENDVNLDSVRKELNDALHERSAQVGVFVLDDSELNKSVVPDWVEIDGNKLLILVEEMNPDPAMLRLAYLWSRWKCVANSESQSAFQINPDEVIEQINKIHLKVKTCNSIAKNLGTASTIVSTAANQVRILKKEVNELLASLGDLLHIEAEVLDDEYDPDSTED